MSNTIFIMGNGFDLDLGWKTRFSDFAGSDFWPTSSCPLQAYLRQRKNNVVTWFDLEAELLDYAKVDGYSTAHSTEHQTDITYFKELHRALTAYLKEQQLTPISANSTAAQILGAICNYGYSKIYSFNYTNLNSIAQRLSITTPITYTPIHGNLADNSIIIGVDESPLRKEYEEFHKTTSEHYRSHNLLDDLQNADEVIFFGLSFGNIDYSYFEQFFQSQADRSQESKNRRKHITIFTYNESSRITTLSRLRDMGINMQHLYSQCNFQVIRTAVDEDKKRTNELIQRLEDNYNSLINASVLF